MDKLQGHNQMKQSDILCRTREDLTALVSRHEWEVHIWTGVHHSPTDLNFCEEDRNAVKPEIIQYYNKHMGDVD
jgi:hypothetical protein